MSEPATKADLRAAVRSLKIWTTALAMLLSICGSWPPGRTSERHFLLWHKYFCKLLNT